MRIIESRGTDELIGDFKHDVGLEVERVVEADIPGVVLRGVGRVIEDAREIVDFALNGTGDLVDIAVNHLPGATRSH